MMPTRLFPTTPRTFEVGPDIDNASGYTPPDQIVANDPFEALRKWWILSRGKQPDLEIEVGASLASSGMRIWVGADQYNVRDITDFPEL